VTSAIVMGNQAVGGLVVDNQAGDRTQLSMNEPCAPALSDKAKAHYRIAVGERGDQPFLRKWCGREKAQEWAKEPCTKRWSSRGSTLRLPVAPRKPYTITLGIYLPKQAVDPENGLYLGETRVADFPQQEGPATITGVIPPTKNKEIELAVRVKTWRPKDLTEGSGDTRQLGVAVRSVAMQAKGAGKKTFDANAGKWIEAGARGTRS